MTTFTLNGTTYTAKRFDFNTVCDMEDYGVSLQDFGKKPMNIVRVYIALSLGVSIEEAGSIMEQEIINGGNFDSVMTALTKEMESSDFFRNLTQSTTKKNPKASSKAKSSTKALESE